MESKTFIRICKEKVAEYFNSKKKTKRTRQKI